MKHQEIQEWANKNELDVMPINKDTQWRLLNKHGESILDIYFKWSKKKSKIVKNSTLRWSDEKWFYPESLKDLQIIICQ